MELKFEHGDHDVFILASVIESANGFSILTTTKIEYKGEPAAFEDTSVSTVWHGYKVANGQRIKV
jgi:hypothetical protein